MIISPEIEAKFNTLDLYIHTGLGLQGEGFLGKRSELRGERIQKIASLANVWNINLSGYSIANAGNYQNCSIGSYGSFADGVKILGSHDYGRITTSICTVDVNPCAKMFTNFKGKKKYTNLYHTFIGHDVWIGANALIKNGLIIGHGAVIGAGSIVTKNVPPYAIVAGNPAKIIKMRFPDEDIERLLNSEWYTYDWDNIEVDWGDLHHCLDIMESYIEQGTVPRLGEGYVYKIKDKDTLSLTPATWTLERQLESEFKTSDMRKILAIPELTNLTLH